MKDWTEMLALLLFSAGPGARPVPSSGLNFPVSKMGARVGRDQCHPACGLQDALVHELLVTGLQQDKQQNQECLETSVAT